MKMKYLELKAEITRLLAKQIAIHRGKDYEPQCSWGGNYDGYDRVAVGCRSGRKLRNIHVTKVILAKAQATLEKAGLKTVLTTSCYGDDYLLIVQCEKVPVLSDDSRERHV